MDWPEHLLDKVKLCNCTECKTELLGESMDKWARTQTDVPSDQLPPLVAKRISGKPYCSKCYNYLQSNDWGCGGGRQKESNIQPSDDAFYQSKALREWEDRG